MAARIVGGDIGRSVYLAEERQAYPQHVGEDPIGVEDARL